MCYQYDDWSLGFGATSPCSMFAQRGTRYAEVPITEPNREAAEALPSRYVTIPPYRKLEMKDEVKTPSTCLGKLLAEASGGLAVCMSRHRFERLASKAQLGQEGQA